MPQDTPDRRKDLASSILGALSGILLVLLAAQFALPHMPEKIQNFLRVGYAKDEVLEELYAKAAQNPQVCEAEESLATVADWYSSIGLEIQIIDLSLPGEELENYIYNKSGGRSAGWYLPENEQIFVTDLTCEILQDGHEHQFYGLATATHELAHHYAFTHRDVFLDVEWPNLETTYPGADGLEDNRISHELFADCMTRLISPEGLFEEHLDIGRCPDAHLEALKTALALHS